jgi:hypothetical protein
MKAYILRCRKYHYSDRDPYCDLVAMYEQTADEVQKENMAAQGIVSA